MEIIEVLLLFNTAFLLVALWGLTCNERTSRQRGALIDWVFSDPVRWRARKLWFDAVSYEQHLWALFFLRDAKQLYGEPPE